MTKPDPFSKSVHDFMDVFMQTLHARLESFRQIHRPFDAAVQHSDAAALSQPLRHLRYQRTLRDHQRRRQSACGQTRPKRIDRTHRSPEDRRAKLLTLSTKGKNLIERGVEERYRWMDKLAVEMNPQDQKKVTSALVILTEAARKLDQT